MEGTLSQERERERVAFFCALVCQVQNHTLDSSLPKSPCQKKVIGTQPHHPASHAGNTADSFFFFFIIPTIALSTRHPFRLT